MMHDDLQQRTHDALMERLRWLHTRRRGNWADAVTDAFLVDWDAPTVDALRSVLRELPPAARLLVAERAALLSIVAACVPDAADAGAP